MRQFVLLTILGGMLFLPAFPRIATVREGLQEAPTGQVNRSNHRESQILNQPKRDRDLQAIIDIAHAVPPEFGADVLIRLVDSNKIAERTSRAKLLTMAFELAESAQEPVKRVALSGSLVDTRSGSLATAYGLNLDRLTLESRIIDLMLQLDSAKARALLERITLPTIATLDCEQPLAYDFTKFYEAVGHIESRAFTRKEKLEGHDVALLQRYIRGLVSHAQVGPVAQLLGALELSSSDRDEMADLFTDSLSGLRTEDARSFAAATAGNSLFSSLTRLISRLDPSEVPPLLRAVREYLVSNLQGMRCGEIGTNKAENSLPMPAQRFNEDFRVALQNAQIAPVNADELRRPRIGSLPKYQPYWQSRTAKEFLIGIKELRFGGTQTQLVSAERDTFAWEARFADFLTKLESWEPNTEPASDFFHEKCILYENLTELTSSASERSKIIDRFVKFLEQNRSQIENHLEWFSHAHDLLVRSAASSDGRRKEEVLRAFLNSRDPILNLYARLELWEPREVSGPRVVH